MSKYYTVVLVGLCMSLIGCSDIYDVSFDHNEEFPLTDVQTYGWLDKPTKKDDRLDELTIRRIRSAISTELQAKGLDGPAADPDARIELTFGSKNNVRRGGRSTRYMFREGYLHIEFVDPASNSLIWIGSAKTVLGEDRSPADAQQTIERVVAEILQKYPAR